MKILLVLIKTLGDVVLVNNIVEQIKIKYPDSKIDVAVNACYKDILIGNKNINRFLLQEDWFPAWGLILDYIKHGAYDEYMIPQQLYAEDNIWHHIDKHKNQHLLNFYLKRCRLNPVDIGEQETKMFPLEVDKANVLKFLDDSDLLERNYFVIHTTSGVKSKDWDIQNFNKLSQRLKDIGYKIVLVGTKKDTPFFMADYDMRDKLNFREINVLCNYSKGFIGLDSGLSYVASASGCNVYSIQGATNNITSGTFGKSVYHFLGKVNRDECEKQRCHGHCRIKKPCVNNISVEDIYERIMSNEKANGSKREDKTIE